jgi:hypothetical protein
LVSSVVVVVVVEAAGAIVESVETVVVVDSMEVESVVAGAVASTLVVSVDSVVFVSQEVRPAANRTATAETLSRFFILVLGLKIKSLKNALHTYWKER